MAKYIISCRYGAYSWSNKAIKEILKRKGIACDENHLWKYVHKDELREDPVAIELLEEKGSEYCSGSSAKLRIEHYDPELWIPSVDEYDGFESLELIPRLSESRIRNCRSFDEVIELLRRLNLFTEND